MIVPGNSSLMGVCPSPPVAGVVAVGCAPVPPSGVGLGSDVLVGTGVFVGGGVALGGTVLVGGGVLVGTFVLVGTLVLVGVSVLVAVGIIPPSEGDDCDTVAVAVGVLVGAV